MRPTAAQGGSAQPVTVWLLASPLFHAKRALDNQKILWRGKQVSLVKTRSSDATETAMGEAFKKANYKDPISKLAFEAWRACSTPGPDGDQKRYSFVLSVLSKDLTCALIQRWNPSVLKDAVAWILKEERSFIEKQQPKKKRDTGPAPVGGGQRFSDTHADLAPVTPSRDDAWPKAERRSEPAIVTAAPNTAPPAAPSSPAMRAAALDKSAELKRLADKQVARTLANIETQKRLSKLDIVLVNGKPIGDCAVIEVRNWIRQRDVDRRMAARDVMFASNLILNLPGNAIVRDQWKDLDEVDRLYEKAEMENAA